MGGETMFNGMFAGLARNHDPDETDWVAAPKH
jgi:hypothetical protein